MKLNPLKPSLRPKKRYLAFEIVSENKINDFLNVSSEIWYKTSSFMGSLKLGKAHLIVLKDTWDKNKQRGIIKINHNYVDDLKASLSIIQEIEKSPVIFKTLGISGILKKAKERYIS
jgi:ribonuclease P/MRP protein subunit POP5